MLVSSIILPSLKTSSCKLPYTGSLNATCMMVLEKTGATHPLKD